MSAPIDSSSACEALRLMGLEASNHDGGLPGYFADRFAAEYLNGATSTQVPLHCQACGTVVAHVHPPAPPVAITCSKCREVTA